MNPQDLTVQEPSAEAQAEMDRQSAAAFAEQGLAPYDQANEVPEPAIDADAADKADESRFMNEFLSETGYFGEVDARKTVAGVDAGRTALGASDVVINYVPSETAIPVTVQTADVAA